MVEHKVDTLTDDQIKILALLSVGAAEEKIAEQLCMSAQAVRVETDSTIVLNCVSDYIGITYGILSCGVGSTVKQNGRNLISQVI